MKTYAISFNNEDDAFAKKVLKSKTDGEHRMKLQRIADKLIRLEKEKRGIKYVN